MSQGDSVKAIITKIDEEKKRISFSMLASVMNVEATEEDSDVSAEDGALANDSDGSEEEEELQIFLGNYQDQEENSSASEAAELAPVKQVPLLSVILQPTLTSA